MVCVCVWVWVRACVVEQESVSVRRGKECGGKGRVEVRGEVGSTYNRHIKADFSFCFVSRDETYAVYKWDSEGVVLTSPHPPPPPFPVPWNAAYLSHVFR